MLAHRFFVRAYWLGELARGSRSEKVLAGAHGNNKKLPLSETAIFFWTLTPETAIIRE